MSMRVAVTGADGFVGKHATRVFRERGHEVIALVGGDPMGNAKRIDLLDSSSVRVALEGTNATHILHLAGASSVARSHENPGEAFAINTLGTVHVLDAARRSLPDARVVLVSSGEVYGNTSHPAIESEPTHATSPYAASKLASEVAARQFVDSYGMLIVLARPFNHIGPGQAQHFVLPSFARQIAEIGRNGKGELRVGNLEAVRDFSHVLDVVNAYEMLLERGVAGETYNIASGEGRSIRSLLDEMIAIAGVDIVPSVDPARLRPVELPVLVGNAKKLTALGWRSEHSLRSALDLILGEARDGS